MPQTLEAEEHIVLEDEYALVLVLLLDLEGHVLLQIIVVRLINETKSSLTKLLFNIEAVRDLEGLLRGSHWLRDLLGGQRR